MSFHTAQHAVETISSQYTDLREQGVGHGAALDFIALEHGVPRARVAALLNDRDAGLHGQSGETTFGVIANDAPKRRSFVARLQSHPAVRQVRQAEKAIFFAQHYGTRAPRLGAVTGRFDASKPNLSVPLAEFHAPAHGGHPGIVDPGTVTCPDAPPEWL